MSDYMYNSSKLITDAAARLEESSDLCDLIVGEGESRVLSSKSDQMCQFYHEFKPQTAAEVKDLLGIPEGLSVRNVFSRADVIEMDKMQEEISQSKIQHATKATLKPNIASRSVSAVFRGARQLPSKVIAVNRLTDDEISDDEKLENHALARVATEAYVYGNSIEVESWIPLIETYLRLRIPKVFVPIFKNISVSNNATLIIASDTLAVYANRIKLYGNGKINCKGPKTLHCKSFEGFL